MLPNIGLMMLNQQNKTLLIIEYIGLYPSCPVVVQRTKLIKHYIQCNSLCWLNVSHTF